MALPNETTSIEGINDLTEQEKEQLLIVMQRAKVVFKAFVIQFLQIILLHYLYKRCTKKYLSIHYRMIYWYLYA